jgi:Ca-activated chloride channel family protein
MFGLLIGAVRCLAEDSSQADTMGGFTGEGSPDDPLVTRGGGDLPTYTMPVPGGSTGTGSGGDGGMGGAGGNNFDPEFEACVQKGLTRLSATMAVEDTNAYAAPAYVRDVLKSENGDVPRPNLIKPHEFFNYYAFPYEAAAPGDVGITAGLLELNPGEGTGEYRIVVGVTAPAAPPPPRMNIAIVVDTSASMTVAAMARARAVAKATARSLRAGDVVSLVTWNPGVPPLLAGHVVTGPEDPAVVSAIDTLYADGGSDLQAGLGRGYELAEKSFDAVALNRVVFISDGRMTLGAWEEKIVLRHAQGGTDGTKPIFLVGAATGPGDGYDETLMARLTAVGFGSYVYVDSEAEATRLFKDRFHEVVGAPAMGNVKLTLTVPGYFDILKFEEVSEGYETNPEAVRGRPLAPGDSMTFKYDMKTCHPSVIADPDLVEINVAWEPWGTGATQERKLTFDMLNLMKTPNPNPGIEKAYAVASYIDALQSDSGAGNKDVLNNAWKKINLINTTSFAPGGDPELNEILALIMRHPKFPDPPQP